MRTEDEDSWSEDEAQEDTGSADSEEGWDPDEQGEVGSDEVEEDAEEEADDESEEAPALALVTGGARRLGARLVRALAAEGFDVAIAYHESAATAEALVDELLDQGVQAACFQADLRDAGACRALVDTVERELGPIGLLVNNAGVLLDADVSTATADDLDRSYALNLRAPYVLALEVGRRMQARGDGSIVNIASTGGLRPYLRHLPYSVTKAGLVMLTQALALALAPDVTVNAIAPGTVWLGENEDDEAGKPEPERIPLEDWADSEDVEDALIYLATAPYVTGQVLCVDGGAHLDLRSGG